MVKCPGNREMHKSTERDTEKHMLAVMKFGGSSVADLDKIRNVAEQCIKKWREGNQVVLLWMVEILVRWSSPMLRSRFI